jgi:hypothetical protein
MTPAWGETRLNGYGEENMSIESIFVLNDIEKQAAESLFLLLESGAIPQSKSTNNTNDINSKISYEYCSTKEEKIIRGVILDCPYKMRYRDRNRIFFSAWNCKDVCSVFYDVVAIIHVIAKLDLNIAALHWDFDVDLNLETYVFYTGQVAGSFVDIVDYLNALDNKASYNSQYIFSIYKESEKSAYTPLLEKLKADNYTQIQILQLWIRGEILYYALADGVILRPEGQRSLTPKEEQDLIRKIYKTANDLSRSVEF